MYILSRFNIRKYRRRKFVLFLICTLRESHGLSLQGFSVHRGSAPCLLLSWSFFERPQKAGPSAFLLTCAYPSWVFPGTCRFQGKSQGSLPGTFMGACRVSLLGSWQERAGTLAIIIRYPLPPIGLLLLYTLSQLSCLSPSAGGGKGTK